MACISKSFQSFAAIFVCNSNFEASILLAKFGCDRLYGWFLIILYFIYFFPAKFVYNHCIPGSMRKVLLRRDISGKSTMHIIFLLREKNLWYAKQDK